MSLALISRGKKLLRLKAQQTELKDKIPLKIFNVLDLREEKEIKAKDWPQFKCIIIVRLYEYKA